MLRHPERVGPLRLGEPPPGITAADVDVHVAEDRDLVNADLEGQLVLVLVGLLT